VDLAPTAVDLVVVVTVRGYQFGNDLVGNDVFPVGASGRAVVEHHLGGIEVSPGAFEEDFDLRVVSDCRMRSVS
jgi:hypothetical protein